MASPLESAITTNAQQPAEVEVDGQKVKQHRLKDQIEADRYLASKNAAKQKRLGLRLNKISPPGTA
ncbi:MAG: hypothetical protein D6744_02240 [Planctomycetota bacterium]|nr:MAG: hypothetical protein D6744_02240 [Planctomycetota bacterium]